MSAMSPDTGITSLGECHYPSPLRLAARGADDVWAFTGDAQCVRGDVNVPPVQTERLFEKAGPRESLYFDPRKARAAIVTCGGLCPGLNNVIRSATLECCRNYGLSQVFGVRFGYQGLGPDGEPFAVLTPEVVEGIDRLGGTILGSSRGSPETAVMVDCLQKHGINILLCVGGDGTQRGAYRLHEEIVRRGLKIAVVGIPKTIDNDIQWCDQTFGFFTAADCAKQVITSAHVEAKGARNGIALVKLMGRDSGFVAAGATLASGEVNFTLIPEQRFALRGENGFLEALKRRILARGHAVVVVAEGAGQHLFEKAEGKRDASGNIGYQDIGPFLKQEIIRFFAENSFPAEIKYIDPSYIVRSVPANAVDGVLCDQLARRAVHAAMAGKSGMLVAALNRAYIHVPIPLATAERRQLNLQSELWRSVLAVTGQPAWFE